MWDLSGDETLLWLEIRAGHWDPTGTKDLVWSKVAFSLGFWSGWAHAANWQDNRAKLYLVGEPKSLRRDVRGSGREEEKWGREGEKVQDIQVKSEKPEFVLGWVYSGDVFRERQLLPGSLPTQPFGFIPKIWHLQKSYFTQNSVNWLMKRETWLWYCRSTWHRWGRDTPSRVAQNSKAPLGRYQGPVRAPPTSVSLSANNCPNLTQTIRWEHLRLSSPKLRNSPGFLLHTSYQERTPLLYEAHSWSIVLESRHLLPPQRPCCINYPFC